MCLCRLSNDHDEEVWKGRLFKLNKSIFISYILITGSLNFRKDNQKKLFCSLFSIHKVIFKHRQSKLFILNLSVNFSESKTNYKFCPRCSSSAISLHSWFCCFSLLKQLVFSVSNMLTWIMDQNLKEFYYNCCFHIRNLRNNAIQKLA